MFPALLRGLNFDRNGNDPPSGSAPAAAPNRQAVHQGRPRRRPRQPTGRRRPGHDPDVYQRGGQAVRVLPADQPGGPCRLDRMAQPTIRDRLAAVARWFVTRTRDKESYDVPVHPPAWCVAAVEQLGHWPKIRRLTELLDGPVLLPSGQVLARAGYHEASGLLLRPVGPMPDVPANPTQADAKASCELLRDVVGDFPFVSNADRSAWVVRS